jgi:transposase
MKKVLVQLSADEIKYLRKYKQTGKRRLREINRANILLLLHKGKYSKEIAEFLDIGRNTVSRTKQKYLAQGEKSAMKEKERPGQPKKNKRQKL